MNSISNRSSYGVQILLPNLIIGGAGRSGTTSLFRYLADHPSVCASSVKEIHFFDKIPRERLDHEGLKRYESHFLHCSLDVPVRMEGTASYLHGGKRTAEIIHSVMSEVKLIFTLREPISRLLTVFRKSRTRQPKTFGDLSFDDFVAIALDGEHMERNSKARGRAEEISKWLAQGCYARSLAEYFAVFPRQQICVLFFDDLAKDVRSVMVKVAEFISIDPHFYDSYTFHVDNKTRSYRFSLLHRLAGELNVRLEPMLNRHPIVRRLMRQTYHTINERRDLEVQISEFARRRLQEFYGPHNRELHALLTQYMPHSKLPEWIASASGS